MKPDFALNLSPEGIALLHRLQRGWELVGEVRLDDPDLRQRLADLRERAVALSPRGLATKLILPAAQVMYTTIPNPGPGDQRRREAIAKALEAATPYAVRDLVFDWEAEGEILHVAVVARETLDEAESFAAAHRLHPVSFVAPVAGSGFTIEPWFGETRAAAAALPRGVRVKRDVKPTAVTLRAPPEAPGAAGADRRAGAPAAMPGLQERAASVAEEPSPAEAAQPIAAASGEDPPPAAAVVASALAQTAPAPPAEVPFAGPGGSRGPVSGEAAADAAPEAAGPAGDDPGVPVRAAPPAGQRRRGAVPADRQRAIERLRTRRPAEVLRPAGPLRPRARAASAAECDGAKADGAQASAAPGADAARAVGGQSSGHDGPTARALRLAQQAERRAAQAERLARQQAERRKRQEERRQGGNAARRAAGGPGAIAAAEAGDAAEAAPPPAPEATAPEGTAPRVPAADHPAPPALAAADTAPPEPPAPPEGPPLAPVGREADGTAEAGMAPSAASDGPPFPAPGPTGRRRKPL